MHVRDRGVAIELSATGPYCNDQISTYPETGEKGYIVLFISKFKNRKPCRFSVGSTIGADGTCKQGGKFNRVFEIYLESPRTHLL